MNIGVFASKTDRKYLAGKTGIKLIQFLKDTGSEIVYGSVC